MNADTTMNASAAVSMELGEDWRDIRDQVRRICEGFPGSYWQDLDEKSLYPDAFVEGAAARTVMEHLGVLILRTGPDAYLLLSASSSAGSFLHAVETSLVNVT